MQGLGWCRWLVQGARAWLAQVAGARCRGGAGAGGWCRVQGLGWCRWLVQGEGAGLVQVAGAGGWCRWLVPVAGAGGKLW